jgi:hypothetical protein
VATVRSSVGFLLQFEQQLRGQSRYSCSWPARNGAGKTTFFRVYLQPIDLPFVNADVIAAGLREAAPSGVENLDQRAWPLSLLTRCRQVAVSRRNLTVPDGMERSPTSRQPEALS